MATMLRRRPPAPSPTPDPAPVAAAQPRVRRKVIPIQSAPSVARVQAYVPPEGEEEKGSGTDYKAVVDRYVAKIRNPKSAIRARCVQCCNGQIKEVQLCPCNDCALHPFRMGLNPFNKRTRERLEREGVDAEDDDGDDE